MNGFWLAVVTLAPLALVIAAFPWIAARVRRRGIGAGLLEPIQDMWDPTVYREQLANQTQLERKAPAPAPDDPDDLATRSR